MRFGMYFEIILNKKWLFSCRNTKPIIVASICRGVQGHYASSPEKILKMWCSLVRFEVYILIRLCIEKFPKN